MNNAPALSGTVEHLPLAVANVLQAMGSDLSREGCSPETVHRYATDAVQLINLYLQQPQQPVNIYSLSLTARALCRRAGLDQATSEAWLAELFRTAKMPESTIGQLLEAGHKTGPTRSVKRHHATNTGTPWAIQALLGYQLVAALAVAILSAR